MQRGESVLGHLQCVFRRFMHHANCTKDLDYYTTTNTRYRMSELRNWALGNNDFERNYADLVERRLEHRRSPGHIFKLNVFRRITYRLFRTTHFRVFP